MTDMTRPVAITREIDTAELRRLLRPTWLQRFAASLESLSGAWRRFWSED